VPVSTSEYALTRDQGFALIFETASVRALLRHGVDQLLDAERVDAEIDPVLTTLSIGAEKLLKLTYGLGEIAAARPWPKTKAMKDLGHNLIELNRVVESRLLSIVDMPAQPWMEGLQASLDADRRWPLVLKALSIYGQSGRFHYLDRLAESAHTWQEPKDAWYDVERAVGRDRPDLHARLVHDEDFGLAARTEMNQIIVKTILSWWELVYRYWVQGAVGTAGVRYSEEINPNRGS
jgi:hypothetical protein